MIKNEKVLKYVELRHEKNKKHELLYNKELALFEANFDDEVIYMTNGDMEDYFRFMHSVYNELHKRYPDDQRYEFGAWLGDQMLDKGII